MPRADPPATITSPRPRLSTRDLLAVAAIAIVTLPILTSRLYASDEIQYFSYLRSIWFDGDLSFDNEYRALVARGVSAGSGFVETNLQAQTDTGLRPNFGTIGSALLWAPFYAVADGLVRLTGAAPADGYSGPYVFAVCVASALYGWLALALSVSIARSLTGRGAAAAAIVLAGTPLLFYMLLAPVFAHATSAFAVALFVFTWLRVRSAWSARGLIALGAAAGLMAMVREQDAFLVIGPLLDLARSIARGARSAGGPAPTPRPLALALGALAGLVTCLPQIWAYVVLNGRVGPSPVVSRKMYWYAPHGFEVLFSPEHGFFLWTPLAVLAVGGLILLAVRGPGAAARSHDTRWIGICALAMVASQVYVAGSVDSWTVAGSFGQRRFVALTSLLVLGLAVLFARAPAWAAAPRAALRVAVALAVWWNLGLMVQFGLHTMDRQRLTLGANAWRTFVTLPLQAPALGWRYLTDRGSFYGQERR